MAVAAPKRAPAVLGVGLLLGFIMFVAILGALLGRSDDCGGGGGPLNAKGIPANLVPIYQAAASRYKLGPQGPAILASINRIETDFGRNLNVSSAGAQGWMQFIPSTWRTQGVDANGDGRKDPYNPHDGIHAAANYLHNSGAPKNWRAAIFAYNRADWYVRQVLDGARRFGADVAGAAGADPGGAAACPGGAGAAALEGTPKHVIDTRVLPLARQHRMTSGATPEAVAAANARHGPTVSGGRSDHQGPPDRAWAADMSNSTHMTPQMQALADDLARAFGIPWKGSGMASATHKGYRVQLIYGCSNCGGDHTDHVHFGVATR